MRVGAIRRIPFLSGLLAFAILLTSCSLDRLAVRTVADFLSGSGQGTAFTGEDDPELVGQALPFALKIYESLLESDPTNASLALATGRAYVSYAFAFVQAPADQLPAGMVDEQRGQYLRAKKLFLRARSYIFQGLDQRRPGFSMTLEKEGAPQALRLVRKDDIDYLYWAGASWMAAFSADPFDFDQIVAIPRAIALLQQVMDWDESYGAGAVHELFISFYGSAPAEIGGSQAKARVHFARAVELSKGMHAGPYVSLATAVSVKNQDAAEFRDLLGKALAIDVDADVPDRLVNVINQRKALWLLDHIDDYFLVEEGEE
jgi:predicted anti-sigma-YlaC factor YlaD